MPDTKNANLDIRHEAKPDAELLAVLKAGLRSHGSEFVGPTWIKDTSYFVRTDDGTVVGGVYGNYGAFNWMYVDSLWVSPEHRGAGYGRKLMDLIEAEAIENGCYGSYLSTFTFQAPGFYKRLGYEVFGELKEFPPGMSRFFLKKDLTR